MAARKPHSAGEMPFLDHLEELRWRIFKTLIAVVVGSIVGYILVQQFGVMEILIRPIRPLLPDGQLAYLSPATPFFVTLKLALVIGVLLAFPVLVYQVWGFLSPGLMPEEKRVIVPSLYFGLVLFAVGVVFAYLFVLPLALIFLSSFQQEFLRATIEVGQYLTFVTRLLLAFGAAFELPVVILILSVLGLVTPTFLREKRRHAFVAITVLSSLLTPGDLASTFLMMGPMWILYEGSIFLSLMIYRRQHATRAREEELLTPSPEPPGGSVERG